MASHSEINLTAVASPSAILIAAVFDPVAIFISLIYFPSLSKISLLLLRSATTYAYIDYLISSGISICNISTPKLVYPHSAAALLKPFYNALLSAALSYNN